MFVQIEAVNGEIYTSDVVTPESSGLSPQEFEQAVAQIELMFENWSEVSHLSLTISGVTRYFNPSNVVWGEVLH